MSRRTVLIVGATSGVGRALALQYSAEGARVLVAGRSFARAAAVASDLRIRHGNEVQVVPFDASDPAAPQTAARMIAESGWPPDVVVLALGDNGSDDAPFSPEEIARVHRVNFGAAAGLLALLLPGMTRRGSSIAFIGSVAGDRGRRGNFIYGSAKAALAVYAQGLRAMLHAAGVAVTTVHLGWVDTRLSYGLVPRQAAISPERAARAIHRAVDRRRDDVYVPGFWRVVMWIVRAIPESIFKRLPIP